MDSKDRCSDCTLGIFCFHETADPLQFKGAIADHRLFSANEAVFLEDQSLVPVAVIQQGGVKLVSTQANGVDQIIGLALPGDYIGLSRLFQECSPVSAITLSRTRVCLMDPKILSTNTEQASKLLKRELDNSRWHQALPMIEAPSRLAQWMLRLADYNQRRSISRSLIQLPLSRTDTANYLHMALETASRSLKRMEQSELIRVDGRQIEILDEIRLRALAFPPAAEKLRLA